MDTKDYWQLFLETGAPEMYMMYAKHLRSEAVNVFDDPGNRPQSDRPE